MKHRVMIALASILVFSFAIAQVGSFASAQPGPPDPKMLEKYKPWFELQNMVNILLEMDKQPGLAFNRGQAKKATPILKDLGSRAELKLKEATVITLKLEEEVVTTKQLTWIDGERLRRAEEQRKNDGRPSFSGTGFPGPKVFAMIGAMQNNTPFNPFNGGPAEDDLKKLLGLLEKR
jgi:hypothetical protein